MIVKPKDSYGNPHAIGDLHDAALGLLRPHDQPVEQRKYITHADIRVKCHNCKTCAEKYDQTDKGSLDNLQPLGRLRCVLILYDKIRFSDIDHLQTRTLLLQKLDDFHRRKDKLVLFLLRKSIKHQLAGFLLQRLIRSQDLGNILQ